MLRERHSHKKYLLPIIFLSIIVIASLAGLVLRTHELVETQNILISTEGQLMQARMELQTTQAKLTATQTKLTETETDLVATQIKLTETETDLAATGIALNTASEQIDSLQTEFNNLQANYNRLTTGYGYVLKDPTYQMATSFLAADKTEAKKYDATRYNCTDFSADVKANAAKQGIRCAYVNIHFPRGRGHTIVAFNTTDRGLIYIEPQSDEEVNLRVGRRYYESIMPKPGQYYPKPDYDDTVVRFTIIW